MMTETMTIHQALAELKMIEKRLNDSIYQTAFVVANKTSNEKILGRPIQEFLDKANAAYQSIRDLMNRRTAIKYAVSLSNAATMVKIDGREYTVAEAIEMRKTGISYYSTLQSTLNNQYRSEVSRVEKANAALDVAADKYVEGLFGGKDKVQSAEAMAVRDAYIKANTFEVIGLKDIVAKMEELSNIYQKFMAEVDAALSVSNALTTITIEY